jgi:uncharacterized phiE125 gp8 family phage protein
MPWIQTAAPAALAVSLSELKAHLRLTTTDEDALLVMYANAAINYVETKTRRMLISRTFRLELKDFPTGGDIEIPIAPLVSVQSVQYYDTSDALITWASSNYYVDATSILGRVVLTASSTYPATEDYRPNAVQVNFTAGYGTSYSDVPEGLRFIVMMLAGHFFMNRSPVIVGGGAGMEVPKTLNYAIDSYKIWSA